MLSLLQILTILFLLLFVVGDPVSVALPPEATVEDIAIYRAAVGLDKPLWQQYLWYMGRSVTGDFGDSLFTGQSAAAEVWSRLPATVELLAFSLTLALVVGVLLGVLAAWKQGTLIDRLATVFAVVGQGMPVFWLGIILMLIFGVHYRLLPISGRGTFQHLILPGITFATFMVPMVMRLLRAKLVESMGEDYIRTARSKGLSTRQVLIKHAFRNSVIPLIALLSVQTRTLIGVSIYVETVFAWPGLGRLLAEAITRYDYAMVTATVVLFSVLTIALSFVADMAMSAVDPRITL